MFVIQKNNNEWWLMMYTQNQRAIDIGKSILKVLVYGSLQTIIIANLYFLSILYGISFYVVVVVTFIVATMIGYILNDIKIGVATVGFSIIFIAGLIYVLFLLPLLYGAYPIYLMGFNPASYVVLVLVIFSFIGILGVVIGALISGYH